MIVVINNNLMYTFNVLCNVYFTQYHLNKFRIFPLSSGRSFSILLDFPVYTDSGTLQITYVTGIQRMSSLAAHWKGCFFLSIKITSTSSSELIVDLQNVCYIYQVLYYFAAIYPLSIRSIWLSFVVGGYSITLSASSAKL